MSQQNQNNQSKPAPAAEESAGKSSTSKLGQKFQELHSAKAKASEEWTQNVKLKIRNFVVFTSAPVCILILLIGSYDFFKNVEQNKCQMTYMYEYPQYIKVSLDYDVARGFPMYGLYVYAEGKHIEDARNHQFTGIPVLYLPGNAGSHKQVRSFATVALRKWLDNKTPFHFDFFSVDFNEELSGMYGYVLDRQSRFVQHVIEEITRLYYEHHHVVIIGHSMGGVLAKSVSTDEFAIDLIFTLATPHLHAPIVMDPELDLFYYFVMRNWSSTTREKSNVPSVVSIGGGDRDFLVSGRLTRWVHNTIHTSTPSIPTVWASTDHLCIVWCKQVVMTVVRSLFDLVQLKHSGHYYAISSNSTFRNDVLRYHFHKRTAGKSYHRIHHPDVEFSTPAVSHWNEVLTHSVCEDSFAVPTYIMFPRITFQQHVKESSDMYRIHISTSNTRGKNWIYGCKNLGVKDNLKYCSALENLSGESTLLPSYRRGRKILQIDYDRINKFSHLVVAMSPINFKTCVDAEIYNTRDRSKYLGDEIKDTGNAMFFNLSYPIVISQSKIFAWYVDLKPVSPEEHISNCTGHHNSIGIFKHGDFQTHNFLKNESLRVRFRDMSAAAGNVLLYLDKGCRYSVKVSIDYIGTCGQFFRIASKLLPSYVASIILMTLFFQKSKDWINFHRILLGNAYYLAIVPGFIVAICIAVLPTDYRYMLTEAEYSALLPMVCYFIAYGLVLLLSLGFWILTFSVGNGLHAILTKFISKQLGSVPDKVSDLALSFTLEKFPLTITFLVMATALSTSGALGLAIGFLLHALKIFKAYEDILEDLLRGRIQNVSEGLSPINFHTHCALLWLVMASVNIPSLVHWINNFRFGEIPIWDLSLYICLMVSPSLAVLWQGFVPDIHPTMWNIQRYLCYLMGIVVVVYGTHRIYLISFMNVLVLISLAICQFISRFAAESDENQEGNPIIEDSYQSPPSSKDDVSGPNKDKRQRSKTKGTEIIHSPGKENLEKTEEAQLNELSASTSDDDLSN